VNTVIEIRNIITDTYRGFYNYLYN